MNDVVIIIVVFSCTVEIVSQPEPRPSDAMLASISLSCRAYLLTSSGFNPARSAKYFAVIRRSAFMVPSLPARHIMEGEILGR